MSAGESFSSCSAATQETLRSPENGKQQGFLLCSYLGFTRAKSNRIFVQHRRLFFVINDRVFWVLTSYF
jgi:hypothetical protein